MIVSSNISISSHMGCTFWNYLLQALLVPPHVHPRSLLPILLSETKNSVNTTLKWFHAMKNSCTQLLKRDPYKNCNAFQLSYNLTNKVFDILECEQMDQVKFLWKIFPYLLLTNGCKDSNLKNSVYRTKVTCKIN